MTKLTYPKAIGIAAAITFAVTLAVLIGNRLSTQAMAVLAGAVCGVGAAIPTSLLIIAVTQRLTAQAGGRQPNPTPTPHPQFTQPVVFALPQPQPPTPTPTPPATWGAAPIGRHFTVVGEMGEE